MPRASRVTYIVEKGEQGITLENIKMSRAEVLAPFVVRPHIEAEPENRATWLRARFDYVTVREAVLDAAEEFILAHLAGGVRLSTTELKAAAKGSGVSGEAIARALKTLETVRTIDFEPGEKGAKLWGLSACREDSGNLGNQRNEVARQAGWLPGNQNETASCLPAPIGAGRQAGAPRASATSDDGEEGE